MAHPGHEGGSHPCYGGGMLFKSEYYSVDYRYTEFKKKNTCSPYSESDAAKKGSDYSSSKNDVDSLIKAMQKDQKCFSHISLINEFLIRNKNVEEVYDKKYNIREELADEGAFDEEIQVNFAFRGWSSALCSVSHVTERNKEYWWLLTKLIQAQVLNKTPQFVTKAGETIDHCGNVQARGSEDLKDFYVSLAAAKDNIVSFTSDAYSVPDQFRLYSNRGSLLFDSTCRGGVSKREIKISKKSSPVIRIEIGAACEDNNKGTAWEIQLSCNTFEEINKSPCLKMYSELIDLLKIFLDYVPPILDNYWMQSLCYEKTHKKVLSKIKRLDFFIESLIVGDITFIQDVSLSSDNQSQKLTEESTFQKGKVLNQDNQISELNYKEIIKNRDNYCGVKPPTELSIFKKVSWIYCFHGLKNLFGE
jgi:hypothetical protein